VSEGRQWTVGEVLQWTKQFFETKGIANSRLDAEVLLAHILKIDRLRLYVDFHKPLQPEELAAYRELIKKRAQRTPVAYLTGIKEFMGLSLFVNAAVLIPRPDTEILVEAILARIKNTDNLTLIDIGTGSGAIILSLLHHLPSAHGIAVDISKEALDVAEENARRLELGDRLRCIQGDLLAPITEKAQLIVSNPPYIPSADIAALDEEVRREPKTALDGGKDGLNFYRKIVDQSRNVLLSDGWLAFEVGIGQAADVAAMIEKTGQFNQIEILKDYGGIERVVIGHKKGIEARG
jgi:release factor glutamine methyltransferase